MPKPAHFNKCRNCFDTGSFVERDPYDVVSGSPILAPPGYYCLNCYNSRVLAAMAYMIKYPERVKKFL